MIPEITLGVLVVCLLVLLFILYNGYSVLKLATTPLEGMSVLTQRVADLDRDSLGNTKMDYALAALNRANNGTPIL